MVRNNTKKDGIKQYEPGRATDREVMKSVHLDSYEFFRMIDSEFFHITSRESG